jgi:hypothetical protein
MFSADTPTAEHWMRMRCGSNSVVFSLPAEHAKAVAFREAAEGQSLTVIALMRRQSSNR